EFRYLLEEVVVNIEEEREARSEVVDRKRALEARLDVADAVGDRECELLSGCRTRFSNVIAADGYRVPARKLLRAELDHVGDDAHGRAGREEPWVLRDELLETVVLDRASNAGAWDSADVGERDVEREQDDRWPIDRHRRRDFGEWDVLEEDIHVAK